MSDEPDEIEFEPTQEIIAAGAGWMDACLGQVNAEIEHEQDPSEENAEKLEEASGEVEAATNLMLDLIREQVSAEDHRPYQGPFRE